MSVVLKVENLSKQYRLGNVGTGTLSHDFSRWWHKVRGKEDPYLKVGEVNDRTQKGNSEYVWALNNINFEVQQGEILGIIGKNGAGKSTLLKILSKVTAPTTGSVKAKGRIASLLEVGTGFHPELTGRENIYLNGAILGMTKVEIRAKLDEIVDFAGVEKYLDTPVKRYSSGMTVRLGFAVAAHLEPEILIVDEVLAVGDAEFQKKAIGKMQDVSKGEGRTVLFVSHNMGVIRRLCKRGVLLKNGVLHLEDEIQNIIEMYENENSFLLKKLWSNEKYPFPYKDIVQLKGIELKSRNIKHLVNTDPISIILHYKTYKDLKLNISLRLSTIDGTCIFDTVSNSLDCSSSAYELKFIIPKDFLNDNTYVIDLVITKDGMHPGLMHLPSLLIFKVHDNLKREVDYSGRWPGLIRKELEVTHNKIEKKQLIA